MRRGISLKSCPLLSLFVNTHLFLFPILILLSLICQHLPFKPDTKTRHGFLCPYDAKLPLIRM